jgi:hypothetical protein
MSIHFFPAASNDEPSHIGIRMCPILLRKYLPSETDGEPRPMGKETAPDYKVIWAMKLEKERLTNLKGAKSP